MQPRDDDVQMGFLDDEGRREQDMVATPAVDGSAHRIGHQPACHCLALHPRVQLRCGIEGRLRRPVAHQLDSAEQPPAAQVADVRMTAESHLEPRHELRAALADTGEQPVALDNVLHGQRRRACNRMAEVRVPMLEEPAALRHCIDDPLLGQQRADRLIAAAQSLGDHQQVGHDTLLLARVQGAGAAHSAHDLVQDQQAAVPVADLAHRGEVAGHRRQHSGRRPADGLRDERDHPVGPDPLDRRVQFGSEPRAVSLGGFAVPLVPVRIARGDVLDVDKERSELAPARLIAADRERAQRVAVVALPPRDERRALRLPDLDEILARHLQRRLDRLRAPAHEIRMARPGRRRPDQAVGEFLGDPRGEEAGVRIGEPVRLRAHRRQHVGVSVAEAGNRGASTRVEVFLAGGVGDEHAAGGDGDGRRLPKVAVQDVRHECLACAGKPRIKR